MPDIDIDFSVRGRERVIRYVTDKYGKESVAQIVTFGKMFPRVSAARERALQTPVGPPEVRLRLDATVLPASVIEDLKQLLASYPGESDVVLDMRTRSGPRRLKLGVGYRVAPNAALNAELDHLLGEAMLEAAAA